MTPTEAYLLNARAEIDAALASLNPSPPSLTTVRDLIEAACAITGSDAATARRLGVARSCVAKWKAGENALPDVRRRQLDAIVNSAKESP
jgi:hypothetical protein